jgi:hypothetical protein
VEQLEGLVWRLYLTLTLGQIPILVLQGQLKWVQQPQGHTFLTVHLAVRVKTPNQLMKGTHSSTVLEKPIQKSICLWKLNLRNTYGNQLL